MHGRALGAVLGNEQPDPTGVPGIVRAPGVLLEHGDLETQFGIQRSPLAFFRNDRGRSEILTFFTHEADAERYLLVRKFPQIVSDRWRAAGRYRWPADAQVSESSEEIAVHWNTGDGEHAIATTWIYEAHAVCCATWLRDVPIEALLQRALRR